MSAEIFVGIDVSKNWLDVALHKCEAAAFRTGNDDTGIASLVKRVKKLKPILIVLEPTGGFEMLVVTTLSQARLLVVAVNPKRVSDFARATEQLAKTDKLGAKVPAHLQPQFGLPYLGYRTPVSSSEIVQSLAATISSWERLLDRTRAG